MARDRLRPGYARRVTDTGEPHFVPDRPPGTAEDAGPIVLTGADLTIADVEAVARRGATAALDVHARARMQEARDVIEGLVAAGAVVYGVTTGFGDLATTTIDPARSGQLQENLLMSHAAGVGQPFPREVVRAMLLLRANTLALGHSGCRPLLVDRLLAFLAAGIHPVVPEQGSVGASGDLAPLAHLALPLIGRGEVEFHGQQVPAMLALREAGLEPLELGPKEGLALLNGTQMMSAIGALLLADADRLGRTASVIAAMSVEALLGTDVAFAAAYQLARPHPGQIAVAAELRHVLRDSSLQTSHHAGAHKVQDPYSLRCVPRSTVPSGMSSITSAACSTSSSTRPPTTRSSSRAGSGSTRRPWRPAAASSSAAATSTASRSPSRSTWRSWRSPSWGRSRSGAPRSWSTPA